MSCGGAERCSTLVLFTLCENKGPELSDYPLCLCSSVHSTPVKDGAISPFVPCRILGVLRVLTLTGSLVQTTKCPFSRQILSSLRKDPSRQIICLFLRTYNLNSRSSHLLRNLRSCRPFVPSTGRGLKSGPKRKSRRFRHGIEGAFCCSHDRPEFFSVGFHN